MATHQLTNWKCDLCGKDVLAVNPEKPLGWSLISIDNPHLDRDWIEKCVCPKCIEMIVSAQVKE